MRTANVVLRFLQSIGKDREAEFYLELFRSAKEQFATLVVDAELLDGAFAAVVADLEHLARLELFPVVVFGLFDARHAEENAVRLVDHLRDAGVHSRVTQMREQSLAHDVRGGIVPVVALPEHRDERERFEDLLGIVNTLGSRKLIYLTSQGGLRQQGVTLSFANMTSQLDELSRSPEVSVEQRAILAQAREVLFGGSPHKVVVTMTSPLDLLRELFTVKGAGTLLRRGAVIDRIDDPARIDRERLRVLLASSFGRPPAESFFARPFSRAFVVRDYRGAAMLVDTPLGSYLTKFVVEREAQGEGIGRDLWDVLVAETPVLFWRARQANPIGPWYAKLCDGMSRHGEWHVFWKGLALEKIPEAITHALAQPVDL